MASSMYTIVKGVIEQGRFELADLLAKIDTEWVLSALTDREREELVDLAREAADPEASLAPVVERVTALEEWRRTVESRLAALEAGGGEGGGGTEPEPSEEWPDYVQPTGAHDAYMTGDKITWKGKRYTCKMDGCVWDPGAYPAGWEYVEDAPAEDGEPEQDGEE